RCTGYHPDLHSFPTRRSSDLGTLSVMTMLDHPCCSIRIAQTHSGKLILSCPNPQRGQQPCNAERPPRCACTALRFPLASSCAKRDRKSTRLNSSHVSISYAVF